MKFSAEAKAILGDDASIIEGSPASQKIGSGGEIPDVDHKPWGRRSPTALRPELRDRVSSPAVKRTGNFRIVRLSPAYSGLATIRKSASVLHGNGLPKTHVSEDLNTPAHRLRNTQRNELDEGSKIASSGNREPSTIKASSSGIDQSAAPRTAAKDGKDDVHDAVAQIGGLSINNRPTAEEAVMQGSVRIKRAGKVTGRFLSGPARRGMKRRPSDEDQSPLQGDLISSSEALPSVSKNEEDVVGIKTEPISPKSTYPPKARIDQESEERHRHRFQTHSSLITGSPGNVEDKKARIAALEVVQPKPGSGPALGLTGSSGKRIQPIFKVPPLPPLPSRFDQENEPPPTFKRNKPNGLALSERPQKFEIMSDEKMLIQTPATSPPRQALAPRNQNTPHRPAPPPPKMTVLETATATAGAASASQSRRKRNYISVNGKVFTRMDCIGRGGSSKVYRVMAENYKVFALKRVMLEDQDETTIRGYKGEIDLLRKLENVDRVVRLFDWEINEEKSTLSVLMEMGESDLSRVLTVRLNTEDAMFDITFTRYFWKEMLECVQAVHAHDIVHSDLKPANFLLAQGRLKLIDFGISNTIQDHTVNVHRDQHVGTPNYMSPETLIDSNASAGMASTVDPVPKLMKLGKPSDVWSLGCILYQMVYGKPPFAHISNPMQRVMAIANSRHAIAFPLVGVGSVPLPSGLLSTLRRCLNRDQTLRPTVTQLLAPADLFLDPDAKLEGTVPVGVEWIAKVQDCILQHIREKGMPTEAELEVWPRKIWGGIRAAVDEGRGP